MSFISWMFGWSRWAISQLKPILCFSWIIDRTSRLLGNKNSIDQDIESSRKFSLDGEVSHGHPFEEEIEQRIPELQTPKSTVYTINPGKFTLTNKVRMLGVGTSSTVYQIDDNTVAKRYTCSEDLLNEKIIYQILGSHPRLLSVHNIGNDFLVMDWMKNGDLARFISSYPEDVQLRKHQWIPQIAESFDLLHRHCISHCDSKLENFLLDDNYDIKICDFASSHNYRALGVNPDELAIQPARYRRAVDDFDISVFNPADDIFAFGSICYEIDSGGPLYPRLDDEDVTIQFASGNFPMTEELDFGPIIKDCWNGKFVSFKDILKAIDMRGKSNLNPVGRQ